MLREVFHVAGAALVDSENKVQVQRFLEIIMHYSNAAISILKEAGDLNELENLEELVADKPLTIDFGASDNSDAIQAAFEAVGAEPVNCKVHIKRNMARQKVNGGKEELKAVRDDFFLISCITMWDGIGNGAAIATVLQQLFIEKHKESQPQVIRFGCCSSSLAVTTSNASGTHPVCGCLLSTAPPYRTPHPRARYAAAWLCGYAAAPCEFVELWAREATGRRKGNWLRGGLNPGLPNDTNGIEVSFVLDCYCWLLSLIIVGYSSDCC